MRQGSSENKIVIRAANYIPKLSLFKDVTFYIFTKKGTKKNKPKVRMDVYNSDAPNGVFFFFGKDEQNILILLSALWPMIVGLIFALKKTTYVRNPGKPKIVHKRGQ